MNNLNYDSQNDSQEIDNFNLNSNPQPDKVYHAKWKKPVTYLGCMLVGAGIAAIAMRPLSNNSLLPQRVISTQAAKGTQPSTNPATSDHLNFITTVVNQTGSAVVRIDSTQTVKNPQASVFNNPLFRQFFGSEFPKVPSNETVHGIGSGFIINSNGEILTNAQPPHSMPPEFHRIAVLNESCVPHDVA